MHTAPPKSAKLTQPPTKFARLAQSPAYLKALAQSRSRENFACYREYVHLDLIQNWWTDDLADELHQFYADLAAGCRVRL